MALHNPGMNWREAVRDLRAGAFVLVIVACGGAIIALAISGAPTVAVERLAEAAGFRDAGPIGVVILGAGAICAVAVWAEGRHR